MPRYPEPCAVSVSNLWYEFAVDPGSREDSEPCRQRTNEVLSSSRPAMLVVKEGDPNVGM